MHFTFGIVTAGGNDAGIGDIVQSIRDQKIPAYEIIIVGRCGLSGLDIKVIPFDETIKKGWITKKKNLITKHAAYDTIVYMHDYVKLSPGWYEGFLKFGSEFDICVTQILNMDGKRFRDFVLYVHGLEKRFHSRALFPYSYIPSQGINRLMYISGAYYIMKKSVAEKFPLNEQLIWGAGEDVDLCFRLTDAGKHIQCNSHSQVQFIKQKGQIEWEREMTTDDLQVLESYSEEMLHTLASQQRILVRDWIYQHFGVLV